jgi:hypothetical protein
VKLASESYEIKNEDKELHAISVILESLDRHVIISDNDGPQCEENIILSHVAAIRCVNYVLQRLHRASSKL